MNDTTRIDFTGRKINGWKILSLHSSGGNSASLWLARHRCGAEAVHTIAAIRRGTKKLCPCMSEKKAARAVKAKLAERKSEKPIVVEVKQQAKQNTEPDRPRMLTDQEAEIKRMRHKNMSAWEYGRLQAFNYCGVVYRP